MFRKYFAHEFKNSYFLPLISCIILLITAGFCGLLIRFSNHFLSGISILLLVADILGFGFVIIFNVFHIYWKRLFNQGGYLTLTLPISTHKIIIVKTLLVLIYTVLMTLCFFFMIYVFSLGISLEASIELFKEIINLIKDVAKTNFWILILLALQYSISFLATAMFFLFLCSFGKIGGLSKTAKVFSIIGMIIGVIIITNINIIPYGVGLNYENLELYIFKLKDMNEYASTTFNFFNFNKVMYSVIGIFAFYFSSYYIIRNKLDIC